MKRAGRVVKEGEGGRGEVVGGGVGVEWMDLRGEQF